MPKAYNKPELFKKKKRVILITHKIIIFLLFLSLSYSTSFDMLKRNVNGANSYIIMSNNNYDVRATHKYRIVIPKIVSVIRPFFKGIYSDEDGIDSKDAKLKNDRFLFFFVNSFISSLTAYFTCSFIIKLRLGIAGGILGGVLFITSRAVILSTGWPLVDSLQYLCIILYSNYSLKMEFKKMCLLLPIITITKETCLPLIFFPLTQRTYRNIYYYISIIVSLLIMIIVRQLVFNDNLENNISLYENIILHINSIVDKLNNLFSFKGLYRSTYTYGIIIVFGVLGYIKNKHKKYISLPSNILILVPYAISLSLLTNDTGRILFIAFPVVIAYSVYFLSKNLDISEKSLLN
tara:strand:+ start:1034 stop:2080 length:1047 start_codon:yes stop_codon:yes gene_type:complete